MMLEQEGCSPLDRLPALADQYPPAADYYYVQLPAAPAPRRKYAISMLLYAKRKVRKTRRANTFFPAMIALGSTTETMHLLGERDEALDGCLTTASGHLLRRPWRSCSCLSHTGNAVAFCISLAG